ncbi:mannuronan epimerase [Rhodococcus sp. BP-316]|uniref:glycosyl hydrolase family 28-related protein n=1 Tax=Rhodococcus sp. BP-316 TaxID=2739445 RepID=UPI001C9AE953|nr:glycosyl hydrolase family 28-related protein [Rhodococcus sp. BP-316]MBY6683215.1 mannuronan epimerase [Rhodococcus sp. BP-316]
MTASSFGRRRLLTGTLVAATVPLAVACSRDDAESVQFQSPNVTDTPAARNVRDFGATGDGTTDDTEAIARAFEGITQASAVYLPGGTYRVTAWPAMADYATVYGDGADVTTVLYEQNGTLIDLRGRQRVNFRRMGFFTTGATSTCFSLYACFRCSFDSVTIRGNHSSSTFPQYENQRGVLLTDNTGGTTFTNCDINNYGIGLTSECIQNYVTASKFTSNRVGVLGTGGDFNAGMAFTNVEFVSDNDPDTTDRHVRVDGPANDWWFTNVWFEGSEVALSIGTRETGGPSQFGMVNCKISARTTCVELLYCRQPYLANIIFDPDPNSRPAELVIDAEHVPTGTAVNLISGVNDDVNGAVFPDAWTVIGRGTMSGPTFTSTVVTRTVQDDVDLLQARDSGDAVTAAVLSDGTWLSDRREAGVVLKDESNAYWRLVVGTDGTLSTESLGTDRPR